MKLTDYYIAAAAPLLIIALLAVLNFSMAFAVSLAGYYVYRCFLDYYKLKKSNIVNKNDVWKFIVPVWTFIYFRELYFK